MIVEKVTVHTIELLKECDAGVKTAVTSIDEVLDEVSDEKLKKILTDSKNDHEKLGSKIEQLLSQCDREGKDPAPMAKAMSWSKINFKLMTDKCDKTIADLMTDGCDMGIKTLNRYKNEYENADKEAVDIANSLIALEEKLDGQLKRYL